MNEHIPHILVIDDDDRLRTLLGKFLSEQGFMVTAVASAEDARRKLAWFIFDALVLDVMMPRESGLELLASLDEGHRPPVLMLSAMGEAQDRIKGLETGADDYLPKPFEPKELVLRLQALLRRSASGREAKRNIMFGPFNFDLTTGQLMRGEETIYLTSNEVAMLRLLAAAAGDPVSREKLAQAIPGAASERSVDVQITRLRKKIEESEGRPMHLQTVRGAGYVLYTKNGAAT
ncbi:MAG: response regulator [Alphaproteobacteria bacterium]|nr:response regulator [Alphaproteobacteria bacterium]